MHKRFLSIVWTALICWSGVVCAGQLVLIPDSTISVSGVQTGCSGSQPYVQVNLLINASDAGRPGLIYVGSHDAGQTQAQFFSNNYWENWSGTFFPPHTIARGGLYNTTLTIPLNDVSQKQGWSLYVGYGVLTAEDENKVQRAIEAVAKVKAKYPERQIAAVDPDHYRRAMVQENMTKNVKYRYVRAWTPELVSLCDQGSNS